MRLATFNVENMFERAKAMNLETWSEGKPILEDFKRLNELIQEPVYTDQAGAKTVLISTFTAIAASAGSASQLAQEV